MTFNRKKKLRKMKKKFLQTLFVCVICGSVFCSNFDTFAKTTESYEYSQMCYEANNKINSYPKDNKKDWYMNYRKVINEYATYLDPPETLYDYYNDAETVMLFKVVQAEIGDEYTFEQKCNVASVILNRLESDEFEDEMFKVLTSDQFATISNGRYKNVKVSDDTMLACEYVFLFGDTTNGCLFFDSNGSLNYEYEMNDGAHNFYKIKEK